MAKVSQAHLEARRRSILEAAAKVFSRKGVATATMAEIAQEAGISAGAIYRYFASKEHLARGCMDVSAEAVKAAWEHPEQIELDFITLSRATFEAIDSPTADVETRLYLERALAAVRDHDVALVEEFREEYGRIINGVEFLLRRDFGERLEGFDVRALAQTLYAFYWGARFMHLLMPDAADPSRQLEALQQVMVAALGKAAVAEPGARAEGAAGP
jgi:AcrR family transcriptional regulator